MYKTNFWFRAVARARCRDDEGVVAIVVALLLVAILFAAALAIDGGNGYATGRQMQNSADSAAMAGMRQLDLVKQGKASAGTVNSTVITTLTNNKATVFSGVICKIVDYNAAEIGDCNATNEANDTAAGVKVYARTKSNNEFGKAVGSSSSFDVARTATVLAKVPTVVANAPFAACAGQQHNTKNGSTNYNPSYAAGASLPALLQTRYIPFVNPPTSTASWTTNVSTSWATGAYDMKYELPKNSNINTLISTYPMYGSGQAATPANARFRVNSAAIGVTYPVHNNKSNDITVFSDCGDGSAGWKGLVDQSFAITIPGAVEADQGAKAGPTTQALPGGKSCTMPNGSGTDPIGCQYMFPICAGGNDKTGNNFILYCTNWGLFQLVGASTGGADHWFKLLGAGVLDPVGGGTSAGTGVPDWNGAKIYQQVA